MTVDGTVIAVPDLRPGDQFEWCGRIAELVRVERRERRYVRAGRRLLVMVEGKQHSLHYFDDESVRSKCSTPTAGNGGAK